MQVGKFDEHCDNLHEVMDRRNAKKYGHKLTFPFPVLNLPGVPRENDEVYRHVEGIVSRTMGRCLSMRGKPVRYISMKQYSNTQ